MSTKKAQNYPFSESPKTRHRFESIALIDDNTLDLFINETILKAAGIAKMLRFIPNRLISSTN
ncbi:MAG: hypothetical protein IPI10_16210 [Bacteroidetes bacterium]|nr:hypothetical protein [Bacteroidota bacterium]